MKSTRSKHMLSLLLRPLDKMNTASDPAEKSYEQLEFSGSAIKRFYIPSEDIKPLPEEIVKKLHPLPNTLKIHQVILNERNSTETQFDSDNIASDEWQRNEIPTRTKKKKETSPINNEGNTKQKNSPDFVIPTRNSFELLDTGPPDRTNNTDKVYVPKPEPIFVTSVINVNSLKDVLNKFLKSELYLMTTLRSGHVIKIIPKYIQTFKMIRENFIANNISHYTYHLKSERAYRVVLRGLHASENTTEISKELYEIGHEVRQIVNIRHRDTKEPLPVFYVDLEPKPNNKAIFDVKYLNNMKITFEAPYKKKEIIQCKRCQRFGHSKNQCFRPYHYVKYGSAHPTTTCTKKPNTEVACTNCDEKHPASYKGCKLYK
ncbi:unnamed protein product [Parnassius apollo]|uniref:(apollo) hypothetical protein n=1 Tax=Parnassius apollo TaxID=110799 RepID=A0A8S3W261_PARAO|nr:unnamed protein product [Parnassius apollo]